MASQSIGIDVGTHAVKIAVVQRRGGVSRATRLFRATLGGDTDIVRIQGALKRAGVTGGPGLLGISGRDLIIRYTHVPPVPDWRLKLLMQFEINEVSGQSGGEVAADYRRVQLPLESDEDTVLVALARNTWLQPRLSASRAAGLSVGGGCPNSVALFNAFLAHGTWQEGESTFLVNLGRENIDMAIQRDGELLFARNMSGGGQMFTEAIMATFGLKERKAEQNKVTKGDLTPKAQARYPDATTEKLANAMQGPAGQLVSMIQSSVMICRAQTKISDLNIDRLLLSGGTARLRGVIEYFRANMSVPVELFDPVAELDLSALAPEDQEELGDHPADFSVALGLAETLLQPTAFRLEVLTASEKKKRHFMERTIWSLGAAAAALLLVVMLFKTRADDIQAVQTANENLDIKLADNQEVLNRQQRAVVAEKDARKKDVALRARRLTGALTRAVIDGLLSNRDKEGHIYLVRVTTESKKVSLGLGGRPADTRAMRGDEEAKRENLHSQEVWPVIKVEGVMKRDTHDPGGTLNAYYTQLKHHLAATRVEGWEVEMASTSLDRENRFSMTFAPKVPAEKVEG
ncbi:MAG: pilus assembly protein PilM [Planctomycetota bacterium]|jgi:type IV pilus assembly protein PilM